MADISLSFRLLDEATIRRMSVVEITNASTYDHGIPKTGGLQDARMGSMDRSILCQTCHMSHCAGHYGLLEFPMRLFFPGHLKRVMFLLRTVCCACCKPLFSTTQVQGILDATAHGMERLKALSDYCRNKISECPHCATPTPQYAESNRILLTRTFSKDAKLDPEERLHYARRFYPDEIYSVLDKIPTETLELIGFHPEASHPRNAILKCILVLPPAQRPTLRIADGGKGRGEDDMTMLYQDVIRSKNDLMDKIDKEQARSKDATNDALQSDDVHLAFCKMQLMVACLIKNTLRKLVDIKGIVDRSGARGSVRTMRDLEHRLKGKTGRLRGTLNAKRTDFSARTVIGIDMCHDIWQLGMPETRMKTLTFPERVTNFNLHDLQQRVARGANEKDGAINIVQPIVGQEPRIVFLGLMNTEQRATLAASLRTGWIVERHLKDGDWVLFNRQPTLHKMNMQAFQVYGIKGLTFRLPLPTTRPFNADYDGDEMNMHVPQSVQAVAEAQELMATPFHMISPSNTASIIAPVQETLVSIFRLTRRDALLTRDKVMQLAAQIQYSPDAEDYATLPKAEQPFPVLPPPAILKSPKGARWTGKQLLRCLLPKSVHLSKAVRDGDMRDISSWMGDKEEVVIIRNGELLLGKLCKSTIGGGASLVHNLWKDVSPWASAKFVSDLQRVGNCWNQMDPLCIGVRDCLVTDEICAKVDDLVATAMGKADWVETTSFPRDVKEMRISGIMQDVLRSAGALVLKNMDHDSALATVVTSGSKGNALNLSQIMAVVGQQSIGGRRVQQRKTRLGMRGMICYKPNDPRPEARGFVATSYIQGQTESEFYHCMMAGREGIVATAVETATSGYNQRKMVKIQEGQIVAYDRSVRVTNSEIICMHYGGDDYDATQLERIRIAAIRFSDNGLLESLGDTPTELEFTVCKAARDALRTLSRPLVPGEWSTSVSLPFNPSRIQDQALQQTGFHALQHTVSAIMTPELHDQWLRSMFRMVTSLHNFPHATLEDDFLQETRPVVHDRPWLKVFSAIALTWTCAVMQDSKFTVKHAKWLKATLSQKLQKALVAPGEAVGTIGATSIGEPSTQGALNVFHFSGIAEKNAMAGMGRFKDLINAAKARDRCNLTALVESEAEASNLAQQWKAVYLSSILESAVIRKTTDEGPLQEREALVWDWVQTWISPLTSKLDKIKSMEAALRRLTSCADPKDHGIAFVVEYRLDKRKAISEHVTPTLVRDKIREVFLDNALVLSTEDFESEWIVRVRPLPFDVFCVGNVFDSRAACEALLDALRSNCLVQGLSWITDSYTSKTNADEPVEGGGIGKKQWHRVGTFGTDLYESAWTVKNPSLLWSNDVQEVAGLLGIEAATLLNHAELQRVLSFDSTYVDPRHTLLLADTMSRCGSVNALNRHKMEELGSSLLQRASFEQTLPVLEEAAFFHRKDPLSGSLERQIVGLPLKVGTGIVTIVQDAQHEEDQVVIAPLEKATTTPSVAPLPIPEIHGRDAATIQPLMFGWKDTMPWSPHVSGPLLPMLQSAATQVYPSAAMWWELLQRNNISILRSTLRFGEVATPSMPKGRFETILEYLENYHGWDQAEAPWTHSQCIYWKQPSGALCCTVVHDQEGPRPLKIHLKKFCESSSKVSWPLKKQSLEIKVLRHIPVATQEVPQMIFPERVVLRQRKVFSKDGWRFTASKEWTGGTKLEAEAVLASQPPMLMLTLDAVHAEASAQATLPVHETLVARWWSLCQ